MSGLTLTLTATLAVAATAGAVTLGSTTGTPVACPANMYPTSEEFIQAETAPGVSYTVPAGGGVITSWSFNTTGATPGEKYGLVVVSPTSVSGYTVVASDTETVPSSPPAVQTYTLAMPIAVQAGDLIGDALEPGSGADCFFSVGTLVDNVAIADGDLTPGNTLTTLIGGQLNTLANIAVNLVQSEDAGITQTSTQSSITTGATDAFLLSVSSTPAVSPVKVTDTVPSGLTIDSVVAGSGSCTTSGQVITCTGVNAPATIAVIVTANQAGQFTNNATVATPLLPNPDPNAANNSSSAALQVTSPPSPTSSVSPTVSSGAVVATIRWSSLARLPLAEARTVIRDLGLKVGKITHEHSKSILKGEVISTSALTGHLVDVGATVSIVASSGKAAPKHR